jgi:hypothetical protein
MKISSLALLCLSCAALSARAAFSPAGTVTFADLQTIAAQVASIGKGTSDPLLTAAIPKAIRNQGAARLFGPMRRGMPGVAVCYVDSALIAKLSSSRKVSDAELDRAKRWAVLYPASIGQAEFLKRHPDAVREKNGAIRVPPGGHSRRMLWAHWSPDGQWAALAPSANMAAHVHSAAAQALRRPLGNDLAYIRMDAAGARAVFQTDACAGGSISVRMTPAGLELRGTVRAAGTRLPLHPGATSFKHVPAHAVLFGVTSSPDDMRSADVFSFAGPEVSAFVKKSLAYVRAQGYSTYFLNGTAGSKYPPPRARLEKIMPEAATGQAANVMFCSPTTVLRLYLPRIAATLMPLESAKMQMGVRMLRRVRGDGLGFMGWREGHDDKFLIRISRDELWGTSALWSSLFL